MDPQAAHHLGQLTRELPGHGFGRGLSRARGGGTSAPNDEDERRKAHAGMALLAHAFGLADPQRSPQPEPPDEHRWDDDGGRPAPPADDAEAS